MTGKEQIAVPSTSLLIAAPPDRVWSLVTDLSRVGDWSPETVSADWLDGATGPAVGARFIGRNKRKGSWQTTCTVIAAQPGREFAFDVGKGETRWRYTLAPADGGCHVTESFEIVAVPGPLGRWLTRLATGVSWAQREADLLTGMQETLRRLKGVAER